MTWQPSKGITNERTSDLLLNFRESSVRQMLAVYHAFVFHVGDCILNSAFVQRVGTVPIRICRKRSALSILAGDSISAFAGANFSPLAVFFLSDGFAFTSRLHADNGESARN